MQQQQQPPPPPGTGFVEDREEAAARVERLLGGYTFCDGALLEDALTHSVHPRHDTGGPARHQRWQRLEFLGDAAIGLAFSTIFYREDPALDEGDLTILRSANVSTQKLARVAVRRNLYPLLRRYNCVPTDHEVSRFIKSVESGDPIEGPKMLADIVEAIIGAVYLDSKLDLEVLQKVAKLLCEPIITKKALLEDPESMLNELRGEYRENLESKILEWRKVANVVDDGRKQAITTTGLGNGSEDEVGELRTIRIEET